MWPYTNDESNWLAVIAVLETSRPRPLDPPSLAELEHAARRYRARVIAGWLKSAFLGLRRLVRAARHRRSRAQAKPPGNVVGAG